MAEEKRDHNSNCTRRPISHVSVCQTVISCVSSAQLSKRFFRCVLSCNLRGNVITNFNTR